MEGTPFPLKRTLVSVCVPGLTSYSTCPSTVAILMVLPSAASANEIGTVEYIFISCLSKTGSLDILTSTRMSPLSPPLIPGSPFPASLTLCPLSIPAGMLTLIFFLLEI